MNGFRYLLVMVVDIIKREGIRYVYFLKKGYNIIYDVVLLKKKINE